MHDPRPAKLADLIVDYSLELTEGQMVCLSGPELAAPLIVELYRAALERGAHPYVKVDLDGLTERLIRAGSEEQLTYVSPIRRQEIELVDASVTIWSSANTRSLSRVDPGRHQRYLGARRELSNRFWERVAAGEARWCGTQFPTNAHAQDAEMSLAEYEDFVYGSCHVREGEDPISHWRAVSSELSARAAGFSGVGELRILGPDTDLKLVVDNRTWIAADGKYNLPDGEVFTSPEEEGTEGEIRFTFPAIFEGREVEDVRLRFERGRVVQAEATRGQDYLRSLLAMDEQASMVGEFAFGLNYEIDRFTRNILFDEKIGGTIHVALGSGFPEAGGSSRSGLHWDMICDLRSDGEIYADGELIWRACRFMLEPRHSRAGPETAAPS
jgi:aminopeptidase